MLIIMLLSLALWGCTASPPPAPGFDPVTMDHPTPDPDFPPVLHELLIPSHGAMLSGIMLGADGRGPHPTVILLHGFPGNEKNLDLAQTLRRAGYNVLFFHFRGAWGSEGEYSVDGQKDDVAAVLDYVRQNTELLRADTGRLVIIGHSLGGFTALRATAEDPSVHCVAGLAAANFGEYADVPESQRQAFAAYTDQLFMLHGYSGAKMLDELDRYGRAWDLRDLAAKLQGRAMLLITGETDTVVAPAVQARLVDTYAKVPGLDLTSRLIPGDHSFSNSRIRLQREVLAWLDRHCRQVPDTARWP